MQNPNFKDPDRDWFCPVHAAVCVRKLDKMVKVLLYHGANLNETSMSDKIPLFEACLMDQDMIVGRLMLELIHSSHGCLLVWMN